MTDSLKEILIKDVTKNPYQPRLTFSPEELEELTQSIRENGLIQPIIVRPSDVIGYELIAGERRLRASQLAGLERIPAIVKNISSDDSMKQAIIENLQRQNLNPVEEAKAYQQLILKNQMTHDEIAKSMGKSRPYISNAIRLLQLPELILKGLEEGRITSGHARLLLSLTNTEKQVTYYQLLIERGLSVRQLEQILKNKTQKQKQHNTFAKDYEKQIQEKLGLEVQIRSNAKHQGKLTITFQNLEDFHRIIDNIFPPCE